MTSKADRVAIVGSESRAGTAAQASALVVSATVVDLPGVEVDLTIPTAGDCLGEVVEVTIRRAWDSAARRPAALAGGITSAMLRSIPVATIVKTALAPRDPDGRSHAVGSMAWFLRSEEPEVAQRAVRTAGRGRPRQYSDFDYARWASAWVDELARGPGALERLAERVGVPPSTMRNRIAHATDLGFLTRPTRRGRQPRGLTEHARQVLMQEETT